MSYDLTYMRNLKTKTRQTKIETESNSSLPEKGDANSAVRGLRGTNTWL